MTTSRGPLTAARPSAGSPEISSAACASSSRTASMPPPAGSACMSRPRATISAQASARSKTPAMTAAANSPTLWPSIQAGVTPTVASAAATAYSSAKIAGWANCVRSTVSASAVNISSRIERPRWGAIASSTAASASRYTAQASCSARDMPGYCEPWPVNSHPAASPRATPETALRLVSSAAASRSAAAAWSLSCAQIASRWRPDALTRLLDQASWPNRAAGPAPTSSASRAAARPRPARLAEDTVRIARDGATAAASGVAGALASTMWALVPPMPKLLTPPRTTPPGNGVGSSASRRPLSASRSCGLGASAKRLGGRTPWCRLSAALTRPAMPAAPSVWPMLPLIDPIAHGASRPERRPCTSPSALTSIMSPSTVPVPWASRKSICAGTTPASRQASVTTCFWAHRLGAVIPLLRPSEFTAPPSITA